ncbi:MAG TPA: CARDB domain-containing protein [Verrucomicrobiae bacterium]|nr:CARDB domain-containing protein [Verrucomicrobiae bacterium]
MKAFLSCERLVLALVYLALVSGLRAQTLQYSYDSMQRLTRVTYGDGTTVDYVYDNLGNRLLKTTTLATAPSNGVPNAVSNPGISNGAVNVNAAPTLSWAPTVDPDGNDSVVYYVYFGTANPPPLAYSGWQTNWAPGQLQCFTTYYWSVVARDNHNAQTATPVWSFTTGDVPPIPDFSAQPASGLAPLTVSFQDQSIYPCGTIAGWQWSFKNNGNTNSTNANPSFTYTASGDYDVMLTLQDQHGGMATIVKTNVISVLGPNIVELVPMDLQVESAGPYDNLVVSYLVTNTGTISLSGKWQWTDMFYLSSNQVLDATASLESSFDESQALPAGAFYRRTNMVTVFSGTPVGEYLFLKADGANHLEEINTNNNVLSIRADTRLPDLVAGGVSISGQPIAGQSLTITYSVTNHGNLDIAGLDGAQVDFFDSFYLSSNAVFDGSATVIGEGSYSGTLPAGAGYMESGDAFLPAWPAGNYWLYVKANSTGVILESNVSNNLVQMPITLGAPHLAGLAMTAPQGVASDARIQVVFSVTNSGSAPALGFWSDTVYLSTNSFWDTNAYSLGDVFENGPVPPGSSYSGTNSARLPGWPAGTYYLLLVPDSYGYLSQGTINHAALAVPITLLAPAGLPNLVPISLIAPPSVLPGGSIQVVYTVTNAGPTTVPTPSSGFWFDGLWLSTNAVLDSSANAVGSQFVTGPVPNGTTYTETNSIFVPTTPPGSYYLILQVDESQLTDESSWSNKTLAVPIQVLPPSLLPQLAVLSLVAPSSAKPGQSIQVSYAVTNQGGSAASGPWFDYLVLSTNTTPDGMVGFSGFLGLWTVSGPLPAGGTYSSSKNVALPSIANGTYFLVLDVDFGQSVNQSSRVYDIFAAPITLGNSVGPTPIQLQQATLLANGAVQFSFANTPGITFSVFSTTDLSLPLARWTLVGNATETSPGQFQFTDSQTAGSLTRFYRVRSP